ncbi:uncharacterized protein BJ212DRAFT_1260835, partial [Suillus subaureus]
MGLGFIDDIALLAHAKTYEEANNKLKNMMEKPGGTLEWSHEHNAEFELDKTALICLSRKHTADKDNPGKSKPMHRPSITIGNHTINPSHSHKFLGIIIDKELRFKEHATYALAKGTKYMMTCQRMIRTTKGMKGRWMRKLYRGVIIPKMLYAADVWCTDLISKGRGKSGGRGARGFASQMVQVHRMATILITGAMRCDSQHSTASDLFDMHADTAPFQQILRSQCHHATLRLATLHTDHPLHKGVASAHRYLAKHDFTKQKQLPSPIHKLFREFKINPNTTETILPIRHYPKWTPDVKVQIVELKEKSLEEDTRAGEELRVYSDGSVIDGGVGGAAVLMEGERRIRESRFHLGKEEEHTVYEGEIVGMILTVKLL